MANDPHTIKPYRFLLSWTLSNMGTWLLATVLSAMGILVALLLLHGIFNLLDGGRATQIPQWLITTAGLTLITLLPATITGYFMGLMQQDILETDLDWPLPHWIQVSQWGGALGGGALMLLYVFINLMPQVIKPLAPLLLVPLFMLSVSVIQWFSLRQRAAQAWLWVMGNTVAGVVFSSLLLNGPSADGPFEILLWMAMWALAAAAQGVITGFVMLWIYERHRRQWDDDEELARVYVEVYKHDRR